jgi:hypothetical protein
MGIGRIAPDFFLVHVRGLNPQLFGPTDLRQLDSGARILTFDRR